MKIIPFDLNRNSKILVSGAGGGFDFLCGLSIILELEKMGHEVYVANYSFTDLQDVGEAKWHNANLLQITGDSYLKKGDYFPERYLAKWYREIRKTEKSVWCFSRQGVIQTLESYNYLIDKFDIDVVICIDGGIDGIFRGDEYDLGTPSMDSISVISTSLSKAATKIYACTAFGIEGAEGKVSHAQALNRMADIIKLNGFLGIGVILKNNDIGKTFYEAIHFIFSYLPSLQRSIILSAILASMDGAFGRTVVHEKTQYNPPWISPLTAMIWYFKAESVAQLKIFYQKAKNSSSVVEVVNAIEETRSQVDIKPYESIPI